MNPTECTVERDIEVTRGVPNTVRVRFPETVHDNKDSTYSIITACGGHRRDLGFYVYKVGKRDLDVVISDIKTLALPVPIGVMQTQDKYTVCRYEIRQRRGKELSLVFCGNIILRLKGVK